VKHEHVIRQSWLDTYFECPEQARLVWTGRYPYDQTEAAAKGTAVHAAIQAVVEHCAGFDEALTEGLDTFRKLSAEEGFRWVKVKREDTCLKHIEGGLTSWWTHVRPTLGATIWCEEQVKLLFHEDDERIIWLSGTPDYADSSGLKDWKLSANQDKYGRDAWKLKRWGIQATVYATMARHLGLYGPEDDVPFEWVALSQKGGKPQLVPTTRTLGDERFLREQVISLVRVIEQGTDHTWPLRDQSALCSPDWCLAYPTCKGQYVNNPTDRRTGHNT
jgi:hypothetical protein